MALKQDFWTFKENEITFVGKNESSCGSFIFVVLFCSSYGSSNTAHPGKFLLLSYGQKCSLPIRFEYSWILSISGMDWCRVDFLHLDSPLKRTSRMD